MLESRIDVVLSGGEKKTEDPGVVDASVSLSVSMTCSSDVPIRFCQKEVGSAEFSSAIVHVLSFSSVKTLS